MWRLTMIVAFSFLHLTVWGQRQYRSNSVLASGNWYQFSVKDPGVYKIDLAFLNSLGVNTSDLSSNTIRIFGNGGRVIPENCNGFKEDDLFENAIWVEDGGDGQLNGGDYIVFFASGPDSWTRDSVNKSFSHNKNIYSDKSFYFLNIGGTGKRVVTAPVIPGPNTTVSTFSERYFHELDTVNFLSSGKQWYGEEFSNAPGKTTNRSFTLPVPNINTSSPSSLRVNCVARSFNTGSSFRVSANGQPFIQMDIPPVATGPYDLFAQTSQVESSVNITQSNPVISFDYTPGSLNSQGWLNWFEFFARRNLSMSGVKQLLFRDWISVAPGNRAEFIIQNTTTALQVWQVTNPLEPVKIAGGINGTEFRFVNNADRLHEYVAFNASDLLIPVAIGKVNNQDLHNSSTVDLIIVSHESLLAQAQRLASFHLQKDNLKSVLVTTKQVFNEFSSGSPDPTAMRDFVKMYYDKAAGDSTKRPKYLLLFGDASFDYKSRINQNTNLVPAWESPISLDPLSTYTSDDFFGFLDDNEDINSTSLPLLDIGIGRIPAFNEQQAKAFVDKIISYSDPKALGPWRNEQTFVADDEDANLHLQDAEVVANAASTISPLYNTEKIYLDAYKQESSASGSRYPDVNQAIQDKIFNGTLIWNYSGHGGFRRLAEEVVLDQDIINNFKNPEKLPLFITATCDVAPYDNPLVNSIGENLLLREKTGAIALMTTTRLVFAFSNRVMNKNYMEIALQRKPDGNYRTLGEAVKQAKNFTYTFFGDVVNNRKFTLLGDPALRLAFPHNLVQTTSINGKPVTAVPDTLKALDQYTISGQIADLGGTLLNNFNGTLYATIFDKTQNQTTQANDPGSLKTEFPVQKNIIFKGKARVANGQFSINFIVPKDINYQFGKGRISYYTDNGQADGNGVFTDLIVGGTGTGIADAEGPALRVYLNDEKFVNGGITNAQPILLIKLSDSSGINVMGTGIGHDLVATLDDDEEQRFVLNSFYETELDNFRKGIVRFQLPALTEGMHSLKVKAWDAANNSSEAMIEFRVIKENQFTLDHVINYPNPFTTRTNFWFDHNRPGEELRVTVQIFTVSGKLVKTIKNTIFSTGNRSSEVQWDGLDDYGNKIGRGVYIYRLNVRTSDGKSASRLEKLFIL